MLYDGISLSYQKYMLSQVLLRIATSLFKKDPQASLQLTVEALKNNYYTREAWLLLGRHLNAGNLDLAEGNAWFGKMLSALRDHPDVTYSYLKMLIRSCDADDFKTRQTIYSKAYSLYRKRPDLQIPLRRLQGNNLYRMGTEQSRRQALILWLSCAVENAAEGALVLPLVDIGIRAAERLTMQSVAVKYLDLIARNMPHRRENEISDAYKEFAEMVTPFYKSLGAKGAATLRLIEKKLTGP
jgi:hypothetical protein